MTNQSITVTWPNGDTMPIDVAITTGPTPPNNSLVPHTVVLGQSPPTQVKLTLTPGKIVTPTPPSTYTPPGSFQNQVYWNDFTSPSDLNDWTIGSGNIFGYAQGENVAGSPLQSAFETSSVSLDGVTNLVITTSPKTASLGGGYATGFVTMSNIQKTTASHSFTYGTFMARIQLPKDAGGEWPAFWALTEGGGTEEFDFLEAILGPQGTANQNDNVYYATLHGTNHDVGSHEVQPGIDITGAYHDVGGTIDQSGNCTWWFDGKAVATQAGGSDFVGKNWFLILNNAVGGWNNGPVSGTYPNEMLVDWVGVWQA